MQRDRDAGTPVSLRDRPLETIPEEDVYYPESDGLPMGESELHIREIFRLMSTLDLVFAANSAVYVGADLMVYYEQGNPGAVVVPDVLVVSGVPKLPLRRSYRIWREGTVPTLVIEVTSSSSKYEDRDFKAGLYAEIGVQEYVLYDPNGEYLSPALQCFCLVDGAYQPMGIDTNGAYLSDVLSMRLSLVDGRLRLSDGESGAALLSPAERMAAAAASLNEAQAHIRALEEELAKLRRQSDQA